MNNYDRKVLKEQLTIEDIFNLVKDLGGEPQIKNNVLTAKTICHGGDSHKLYYYPQTHLFHCYTGCGDASFDIYELIIKINNTIGKKISLSQAITFVARYFHFNITTEDFDFKDNLPSNEDWKIINNFKNKKTIKEKHIIELKNYDNKILKHLPHPHIAPWEQEGISYNIIKLRQICYDPLNEGVVIPHYDIDNNLIGIRERTLIKENEVFGKYRPAVINGIIYNHPLGLNLYNLNNSKQNIQTMQKAIIFEGEKSCLKFASYFGSESDISVACCGSNITDYQIKLLLSLNIKEIIIALDKQFQNVGDEEWKQWIHKLKSFYYKYGSYIKISYLFDKNNLLNYKDSPIDQSKEIFLTLFNNRISIE